MSVHKFTVPDEDLMVEKWIARQSNFGVSVRMLIKLFVQNYGYGDVTCMAIGLSPKKRGRPSKQLQDKMDQMFGRDIPDDTPEEDEFDDFDTQDSESEAEETVSPVEEAPVRKPPGPVKAKPKVEASEPQSGNDDMMAMFDKPLTSGNVGGSSEESVLSIDSMLD